MQHKSVSILQTRREFIRQAACAALGTAALTSAIRDLRFMTAAVAQTPPAAPAGPRSASQPAAPVTAADTDTLIAEAARDLAEYQRLTAEGKLGEAGQRLEALKQKLEQLAARKR